jgi:hypothetical protein
MQGYGLLCKSSGSGRLVQSIDILQYTVDCFLGSFCYTVYMDRVPFELLDSAALL